MGPCSACYKANPREGLFLSFGVGIGSAIATPSTLQEKNLTAEWTLPWVKAQLRINTLLQEAATRYAGHLNVSAIRAATFALTHLFGLRLQGSNRSENTLNFLKMQGRRLQIWNKESYIFSCDKF